MLDELIPRINFNDITSLELRVNHKSSAHGPGKYVLAISGRTKTNSSVFQLETGDNLEVMLEHGLKELEEKQNGSWFKKPETTTVNKLSVIDLMKELGL